ncbi:MAG: S-layer homology domain-containing protein, partial [Firmicutes bacterium]|nr:S-layer homology domain-containing protein [Bacillota bacterium]
VLGGGAAPVQDYALVWGQAPAVDMVKGGDGRSIALAGGSSFSPAEVPVVNLVNGSITPVDAGHIFPGAAVYLTPPAGQRAYLAARLWRAAGVKALKINEKTVFTEINPDARLGGYTLAADAGEVMLNKSPVPPGRLPPGFEVSAVVNPVDQKIRQVCAAYIEREGVVLAAGYENGGKKLYLAGGRGSYRISPEAVCSYEDSYANVDAGDMPFGTGALEELEEVLPGMPVLLRLAPSTGEVQYLAVKRLVALGAVREVTAGGEVWMENGASYRIFPGAPVKRDRQAATLGEIKPGDRVAAVLLPDTDEAIGLVACSSVLYGKAIDFTRKDRTLYFLDDSGRYRSLHLPPDAVVYRWGVRTTADNIAAGSRIRVTTDPAGKEAWRIDIADVFSDKGVFAGYDGAAGILNVREGGRYRVSKSTRFYKNGCPVPPEDLRAGEQVEVEYVTAPPPTGNVLVSVSARTTTAGPPLLLVSAVPLQGRLAVTGRTGPGIEVLIWEKAGSRWTVPVDGNGKFNFSLQPGDDEEGYDFTLVAVDRRTGGVTGRQVSLAAGGRWGGYSVAVLNAVSGAINRASTDVLPGRAGAGYLPDVPLTRASAVTALARLLNWPRASEWPLPFADAEDIPAASSPAVAEARARGIVKGYPDGSFLPGACLNRAEAAVILAAALRDLGLGVEAASALPYSDAAGIPPWAVKAVAETTAAWLWCGRPDGSFAPGGLVTAGEMADLLERLLPVCEGAWEK